MQEEINVDRLVDAVIDREGGYVENPTDKGGATRFGITEQVAHAHCYAGAMRGLRRSEAAAIYKRLHWSRPRLDEIAKRSAALAAELFDTGVNMGPAVAVTFLQRALTALNRNGKDFADLAPDGRVGAQTLAALDAFLRCADAGVRRCSSVHSRRCRANATSASLSAAPPMRPSCTAGSRTGLARERSQGGRSRRTPVSIVRGVNIMLQPPKTFAEGQRYIYGLLAADAAGMFCGACAVFMVAPLMWGGWSRGEEHSIVAIFGWSLSGFIVAMVVVIVALLAGGPVGRFKVSVNHDGPCVEPETWT